MNRDETRGMQNMWSGGIWISLLDAFYYTVSRILRVGTLNPTNVALVNVFDNSSLSLKEQLVIGLHGNDRLI